MSETKMGVRDQRPGQPRVKFPLEPILYSVLMSLLELPLISVVRYAV